MSRVSVRWGRGQISLEIPAGNLAGRFQPEGDAGPEEGAGLLADAVEASSDLFEGSLRGRRVCLLVSDGTREEPREIWARALAPLLRSARSVLPVLATGSHDPRAPYQARIAGDILKLLRAGGVETEPPFIHDPFDRERIDAGVTSRGTPVRLARRPMEADAFVIVSDMKPHYFAGYSCPPKFLFPGVAALESIEANHSLTLDPASVTGRHPWHPDPARRPNPLAEDVCEAFAMGAEDRPALALAFGSTSGKVRWAEAGTVREATARGIGRVDDISSIQVAPSRHVIVSPGGYPNDIDLYVGQRALELTAAAMADGGEVLFLCQCEAGLGPAHALPAFLDPLQGDLGRAAAGPPGAYRLYAHKPVRLARMILRLGALWLHSRLGPEETGRLPLHHAPDPQAVVRGWLRSDPSAGVLVLDGASKLSVRAA